MGTRTKRAFTLIELLVVIAIIALLIGILLPALGEARRSARLAKGMANIRSLVQAGVSYGSEFKDSIATFSWKKQKAPPIQASDPSAQGLTTPQASDSAAACAQMAYIIRSRGDRTPAEMPMPLGLFPYLTYSHLVLQDYLSQKLPDKTVINPEDRNRDLWSSDPRGYDTGLYMPNYGSGVNSINARHPYGASYRIVAAAVDKSPMGVRVWPNNSGSLWVNNNNQLGGRKITEVAFPSQKVYYYDTFGRHFGKFGYQQWQGFQSSQQPLGCFDGSVVVRANKDVNEGADPNQPTSPAPPVLYVPDATGVEPRLPAGANAIGKPYFSFTRGGLQGVDFKGGEVRTNGY